jgi:hypothetical protein
MDRPRRKTFVTRDPISAVMPFGAMMGFSQRPPLAAHRRYRATKQQRKHFLACTDPPDASRVHENNLIDQ